MPKKYSLLCLVYCCLFNSLVCQNPEPVVSLTEYQRKVINYFKEVALGFENGNNSEITRKWVVPMKIYLAGQIDDVYINEVLKTIDEINELSTDGFYIKMTKDSVDCNAYIYFGSKESFLRRFPDANGQINSNFAIFNVWWRSNRIYKARVFIDLYRPTTEEILSLIKEEMTQILGLGKDSPKNPDSIFYETLDNGGFVTEFSDLDRELIRLLYHPKMKVGLNANRVERLLIEILSKE